MARDLLDDAAINQLRKLPSDHCSTKGELLTDLADRKRADRLRAINAWIRRAGPLVYFGMEISGSAVDRLRKKRK